MNIIGRAYIDVYLRWLEGYIRDDPAVNRLIDGKQFSPIQLELALQIAFDRLEMTPPHLHLGISDYPMHVILRGATLALFEMAQIVDTRNSLDYQDNTLSVRDTHEEKYGQLIQQFYTQFAKELAEFKVARNISMSMEPMWQA